MEGLEASFDIAGEHNYQYKVYIDIDHHPMVSYQVDCTYQVAHELPLLLKHGVNRLWVTRSGGYCPPGKTGQ